MKNDRVVSHSNILLLVLSVTGMIILAAGLSGCQVGVIKDEEGNSTVGISTRTSNDNEHEGNYLAVGSGDLAETLTISEYSDIFECQIVMEYMDSALVCYRDSMGVFPENIGEAWNFWWGIHGSESDLWILLSRTRTPPLVPYSEATVTVGARMETANHSFTGSLPECPSPSNPDSTEYIYQHTEDSYSIRCPAGHGSIQDGKRSWE